MSSRGLSRLVGPVLLAALLENWGLVASVVYPRDPTLFLVCGTWMGLLIASTLGLLRGQRWGAYLLLLLAPFSTIMLATPLIPGMHLIGLKGPVAVAAVNVVVLAVGIFLARTLGHPHDQEVAA